MAKFKVYGFAKMKSGSMEPEIGEFKKAGVDVEVIELKLSGEDDLIEKIKDADVVMGGHMFNRRVIESLPKCQMVITYSVGYDGIDIEAATENGLIPWSSRVNGEKPSRHCRRWAVYTAKHLDW
jgi:phosphoglycerate dehydrogenase-like enzyme